MRLSSLLFLLLLPCSFLSAEAQSSPIEPEIHVYKTIGDTILSAHIFYPGDAVRGTRMPVIVLIHGGGWNSGSPEWVYEEGRRYAKYGAAAVAIEYRLSDSAKITPLDSLQDARDLVLWLRANDRELGINSSRMALYGVSAGGQLAAALATLPDPQHPNVNFAPKAMVMVSPALSLTTDTYFQGLLLGKATAEALSPDEHIHRRLPPTIIFHGVLDSLVPISGARRFCQRARQFGSECKLIEYPGVGHLFTRKLDNQMDSFDPDPKDVADAIEKGDAFLAAQGFLPRFGAVTNK
jgi:acetyl esterase